MLVVTLAASLHAQRIERSHIVARESATGQPTGQAARVVPFRAVEKSSADTVGAMLFQGLVFGAAGMFAGGFLGYQIETSDGCDDDWLCGLGGMIIGGLIGETVGMVTGIHQGGGRRSPYSGDLALGLAIAGVGYAGADATEGITLLAVPVAQLVFGMMRERGARRAR
jgi:hypothetical protein